MPMYPESQIAERTKQQGDALRAKRDEATDPSDRAYWDFCLRLQPEMGRWAMETSAHLSPEALCDVLENGLGALLCEGVLNFAQEGKERELIARMTARIYQAAIYSMKNRTEIATVERLDG